MRKIYLLDTNILMQTEGNALLGFEDNEVCITTTTLEELDGLKKAPGEVGYSAREAIRMINNICNDAKESVLDGVPLENGGVFKLISVSDADEMSLLLPPGWKIEKADNRILSTAKRLFIANDEKFYLITNDISMKIKAEAIGVPTQQYHNEQVSTEEKYTGRTEEIADPSLIAELFCKKEISSPKSYTENMFIHLTDGGQRSALAMYRKGNMYALNDCTVFGIRHKNQGQRFLLEALLLPPEEISLVVCNGVAGSGKTLLSIAAGLDKTMDDKKGRTYDKILITRSNTLSDEDIGYLPGTLEEKMKPLLAPFMDNLLYLMKLNDNDPEYAAERVEDLMLSKTIEICSLSYIRGRSLPHSFIIVDEAQNLTRLQAKTIVTRAGEGTKIVFLGDLNQIDNPKLDKKNNGLAYLSEKFKDCPLCAQIDFKSTESVRSPLAIEAIRRLE